MIRQVVAEGVVTHVDTIALSTTKAGGEYRWSDVQRYNNSDTGFDDRMGEPLVNDRENDQKLQWLSASAVFGGQELRQTSPDGSITFTDIDGFDLVQQLSTLA